MTTRYQKEHYEDVARILSDAIGIASDCDRPDCGCKVESPAIAQDFADLFAADNPKRCSFHHNAVVHNEIGYLNGDCHIGGFDRERFLAACGLES